MMERAPKFREKEPAEEMAPEFVNAEKLAKDEGGFLTKIAEKSGKKGRAFLAGLTLLTAVAATGTIRPREARAQETPKSEIQKEDQKTREQFEKTIVLQTWQNLINMPDNPLAKTSAQNEALKEEAAHTIINGLAVALKLSPKEKLSGVATPQDLQKALDALSGTLPEACSDDKKGVCDIDEIEQFRKKFLKTPGGKVYWELVTRISR